MPKLTKKMIDSTPSPADGQVFIRDTEIQGFALRLTPGSKTFIIEKRIDGRPRRLTLGPYGPLTVEQARGMALEKIGQISQGQDPAQERQDKRREMTFGNLADLYKERHLPRKAERSGKNDKGMLNTHLEQFKNFKLSAVTRNRIAKLHGEIGKNHPHHANRMIALVRKMFNLAKTWGLFDGGNPATGIELFKERSRERFFQPEELLRFLKSLEQEQNPYTKAAFLLLLLTGARSSEVLKMRWSDVDLDRAVWCIPKTKAGRSLLLPLPKPAVSLLNSLPRLEGNPYVLPGRKKGFPMSATAKPWKQIINRAEIQAVRVHDLRRTVGSWMAGSGESLPMIGRVLGHTTPQVTQVYARLALDPVREALERNAERMMTIGGTGEIHEKGNDESEN